MFTISATVTTMATTAISQSPLLSLPIELRLRIYHFTLRGWHILVDAWCDSLSETLALDRSHSDFDFDPDRFSLFHVNRQIRSEAASLLGQCATLEFLRGPRSPWDRRWRTSGKPLPELLRQRIELVWILPPDDLSEHYVLPLKGLPALKEVRFSCGHHIVDSWGKEWSRDWANYEVLSAETEGHLVGKCRETCHRLQWVRDLTGEESLPFRLAFESGIMFPDIRGLETKTMYLTYTCDFKKERFISRWWEASEAVWIDDSGRWTIPVKDLWQLGSNSKLDSVVKD